MQLPLCTTTSLLFLTLTLANPVLSNPQAHGFSSGGKDMNGPWNRLHPQARAVSVSIPDTFHTDGGSTVPVATSVAASKIQTSVSSTLIALPLTMTASKTSIFLSSSVFKPSASTVVTNPLAIVPSQSAHTSSPPAPIATSPSTKLTQPSTLPAPTPALTPQIAETISESSKRINITVCTPLKADSHLCTLTYYTSTQWRNSDTRRYGVALMFDHDCVETGQNWWVKAEDLESAHGWDFVTPGVRTMNLSANMDTFTVAVAYNEEHYSLVGDVGKEVYKGPEVAMRLKDLAKHERVEDPVNRSKFDVFRVPFNC